MTFSPPAQKRPGGSWVQTERKAHEAWANLIGRKPAAARVMHLLVANMGEQNAVVISQKTLAKMMGSSIDTVQRALQVLVTERWVQIVKLNGPGTVAAHVVNDRVAWGRSRDDLRVSVFSAAIIADAADQDAVTMESVPLQRIPSLFSGELQLPAGDGLSPSSEPALPGMEPDLPALRERERGGEEPITIGSVLARIPLGRSDND